MIEVLLLFHFYIVWVFFCNIIPFPFQLSCQSICLIVPGGDGEKLINGCVRGHRDGWAGLGQDVSPWLGSGSGPMRGTGSGSAPAWPTGGRGSSLGLELALSPNTKSPAGAQSQPPHSARGIPTPLTLVAEGSVCTPMSVTGVWIGPGWVSVPQGALGKGSRCSA